MLHHEHLARKRSSTTSHMPEALLENGNAANAIKLHAETRNSSMAPVRQSRLVSGAVFPGSCHVIGPKPPFRADWAIDTQWRT